MHGDPIKYEVDKDTGAVFVDRFMSTSMHYPCNYGYIPATLSDDGDPCDVLVHIAGAAASPASSCAAGRSACSRWTTRRAATPRSSRCPSTSFRVSIARSQSPRDLPEITTRQIAHFFEHYKDLEPGKWVRVSTWVEAQEAKQEIVDGVVRYRAKLRKPAAKRVLAAKAGWRRRAPPRRLARGRSAVPSDRTRARSVAQVLVVPRRGSPILGTVRDPLRQAALPGALRSALEHRLHRREVRAAPRAAAHLPAVSVRAGGGADGRRRLSSPGQIGRGAASTSPRRRIRLARSRCLPGRRVRRAGRRDARRDHRHAGRPAAAAHGVSRPRVAGRAHRAAAMDRAGAGLAWRVVRRTAQDRPRRRPARSPSRLPLRWPGSASARCTRSDSAATSICAPAR